MRLKRLAFAALVPVVFGSVEPTLAQATKEVIGRSAPNRWEHEGVPTPPATIGNVEGRLLVKVRPGDVVAFKVATGTHRALFENAKAEMDAGVWEIEAGSGTLAELPAGQFPHYNHAQARSTVSGTGDLIRIKIKDMMRPGPAGAILFACNPHSESPTGANVPMLGAIVRDDAGGPGGASRSASTEAESRKFLASPRSESCRLIDFERAEVRPGFVNGTYILVVSGTKPYLNMEVRLAPLVYVRQPEYWAIEVVGCLNGPISLPATAPYAVSIPLAGITGTRGIEVVGATTREKKPVPSR